MTVLTGYSCPACDYRGPHDAAVGVYDGVIIVECGSCYTEFEIPDGEGAAG